MASRGIMEKADKEDIVIHSCLVFTCFQDDRPRATSWCCTVTTSQSGSCSTDRCGFHTGKVTRRSTNSLNSDIFCCCAEFLMCIEWPCSPWMHLSNPGTQPNDLLISSAIIIVVFVLNALIYPTNSPKLPSLSCMIKKSKKSFTFEKLKKQTACIAVAWINCLLLSRLSKYLCLFFKSWLMSTNDFSSEIDLQCSFKAFAMRQPRPQTISCLGAFSWIGCWTLTWSHGKSKPLS